MEIPVRAGFMTNDEGTFSQDIYNDIYDGEYVIQGLYCSTERACGVKNGWFTSAVSDGRIFEHYRADPCQ